MTRTPDRAALVVPDNLSDAHDRLLDPPFASLGKHPLVGTTGQGSGGASQVSIGSQPMPTAGREVVVAEAFAGVSLR
jgi:hypothetical protein